MPTYDEVEVGTTLGERSLPITRMDLVRYAGASGDFNVIHQSERVAKAVGLPDVIAHGMLTMAMAGRVVTDWAGDPGRVESYKVRFSAPVVVPDDDTGTAITVTGTVTDKRDDGRVVVALAASTADGTKVLSGAEAVVRLDRS
jgi:acyl dehydratase